MTATITNHLGRSLTGEVRCWMGRRIVEVETPDGARHIGRLRPDRPAPRADVDRPSTVDETAVASC
jgi:hypothetical protein